jgi:uncharacterized protein YacL
VFVEIFRLLIVVFGAVGGLQAGQSAHHVSWAPLAGVFLGAGVAYVLGGVLGRVVDQGVSEVVRWLRTVPAAEVLAAAVVGTAGLLLGLVAAVPALILVHSELVLPAAGVVAWVLCAVGVRLGAVKGRDVARAAGIAHLLDPRMDRQVGTAVVADTSAVLDAATAVLAESGLLSGGLMVPRFVVDEVRLLAEGPDGATARRARRGLEQLAALRDRGASVSVLADEPAVAGAGSDAASDAPGAADRGHLAARVVAVAQRVGGRVLTASTVVAEVAQGADVPVVDLRALLGELVPEREVGERLVVDLVRPGRLARQAVGYLPSGDMVVVNDAGHLVGADQVPVEVAGWRRTSQGVLVFAHLAPPSSSRDADGRLGTDGEQRVPASADEPAGSGADQRSAVGSR